MNLSQQRQNKGIFNVNHLMINLETMGKKPNAPIVFGNQLGFDLKRNMPFDGVAHNALADARHQAKYVSAIWQKLLPSSDE